MTSAQLAILIIAISIVAAGVILLLMRGRSRKLQTRFGPEYDRAVSEHGSRLKAEAQLEKLEKRVDRYSLRPLELSDRDRFQQSWRQIQATFVDNPEGAFSDADQLLINVMSARGYPMTDFEQRAAEISVDHAAVVDHYRAAHGIAVRHSAGRATTEELRQGMIHYRALFQDLIGEPEKVRAQAVGQN
jgi:hypothetical protein